MYYIIKYTSQNYCQFRLNYKVVTPCPVCPSIPIWDVNDLAAMSVAQVAKQSEEKLGLLSFSGSGKTGIYHH